MINCYSLRRQGLFANLILFDFSFCKSISRVITLPSAKWNTNNVFSFSFIFFSWSRSTTYPYTETQMYSQNTGGNYFDTQGSSAQVTTVVSSHSMVGTGGIQMGVTGGQLISSSGGTYLIGNSMENSGHTVTHTTRASPATVSISDWCKTFETSLLVTQMVLQTDMVFVTECISVLCCKNKDYIVLFVKEALCMYKIQE